jgi:hypothetical protein
MDTDFLPPFSTKIFLRPYVGPHLRTPEEQLRRQLKKTSQPLHRRTQKLVATLRDTTLASPETPKSPRKNGAGEKPGQTKRPRLNLGEVDMVRYPRAYIHPRNNTYS